MLANLLISLSPLKLVDFPLHSTVEGRLLVEHPLYIPLVTKERGHILQHLER